VVFSGGFRVLQGRRLMITVECPYSEHGRGKRVRHPDEVDLGVLEAGVALLVRLVAAAPRMIFDCHPSEGSV
jgi:hypothetical protein